MVMKKLNVKLIRDIKDSKGQFIAIAIVIAIGAFLFAGFSTFSRNLKEYADEYYQTTNLADLTVYYAKFDNEDLRLLEAIEGIKNIEGRYVTFANQKFDDLATTLKLHSLADNNKINKLSILEGQTPKDRGEIVIDTDYAKEHNYNLGDYLELSILGKIEKMEIIGLCESSEYVIKSRNTSDFPPNHSEYGIAYISDSEMQGIIGENVYNEVLIEVEEDANLKKIEKQIQIESEGLSYLYSLRKDFHLSYKQFTGEIKQQGELAKILPIIFFGVAAIITFLALSRIVEIQRIQIGIMKALGIQNINILSHFIGYSVILGLVGGTLGSIAGSMLFPRIFMEQVKSIMSIPGFKLKIYPRYIFEGILLSIVFGMIASFMSCKTILKEKASEAMRIKAPKNVNRTLIERNKFLWNKLSYGNKLIIRNIFINKKRTIYSSLGIVSCVAFLILAFGYKGSRALLIDKQFNEVYQYDLRVVYKNPINDIQDLGLNKDGLELNTVAETSVIVANVEDSKDSNLIITNKEFNFINNFDSNGKLIDLDDEGVIISERFAEQYGLSLGDTLELKMLDSKFQGKSIKVKISNISVQYLNQEIFCTSSLLKKFEIDCIPNILLLKVEDSSNIRRIYTGFTQMTDVKEVKSRTEVKKATEEGLKNLYNMIIVIIISAIAMSFAAIYNISKINITERVRELATLKVLGYKRSKINRLIFVENMFITIFSIFIGTPVGIFIYKTIIKSFTLDNMVFPVTISPESILQSALITIAVTIICNLFLIKEVKKIDMVESLKSID